MSKPTFDEWYEKRYGSTFERDHTVRGYVITAQRALLRYMRQYVSEMVQPEPTTESIARDVAQAFKEKCRGIGTPPEHDACTHCGQPHSAHDTPGRVCPKPGTVTMMELDELKARARENLSGTTDYMRGTTPPLTWKTERPETWSSEGKYYCLTRRGWYPKEQDEPRPIQWWHEPNGFTFCAKERYMHEPIGDEV